MNLLVALLTLGLVGEAQAKKKNRNNNEDKVGLRVKLSTPVLLRESTELDSDDNDDDDPAVTSGIALFTQPARAEMTYMLGDGFELGGMLGFSSLSTDVGDNDSDTGSLLLAATGSYNFRLDREVRGFLQPTLGITRSSSEAGSTEQETRGPLIGLGGGVRFRYVKRATVDVGAEYTFERLTPSTNGDEADDDFRVNTIALRIGLSGIL